MRCASALMLILLPGCELTGADAEDGGESETAGERTLEQWIALCESQTSRSACEAVPAEMVEGETLRCADLIIVKTSAPDCFSGANDSRCLAVSDAPSATPGYIFTDSEVWLIEPRPNTTVHGSAIASCVLDDDGVTWTPDAMCGCAGKVTESEG
jgi:hypothetical protein